MPSVLAAMFGIPLVLLAIQFPIARSLAQNVDLAPPVTLDVGRATNNELIDDLANIADVGVGFHPTAWVSAFVAVDGEPQFDGGLLGSQSPSLHPALKELVSRGATALPELIEHLSDDRETKLSIGARGFGGGTWHSDEYDSRYRDEERLPEGVNTEKEDPLTDDYVLRVGDLCSVAIGQIVNRRLNAVRYQPSGCYVINSPVVTKSLAEAVKNDWAHLTAEDHERSLIADAQSPYWGSPPPALERLAFYYPEAAEPVAASLLARTLYDSDVVWTFIEDELVKSDGPNEWRELVRKFRDAQGAAIADTVPYWLHWIYWETDFERDEEFLRKQQLASEILKTLFSEYDVENPPALDAAEVEDQVSIVRAVRRLKSDRVDESMHRLFISASRSSFLQSDVDELAVLGLERAGATERRGTYGPYFENRIQDLERDLAGIADDPELKEFIETRMAAYRAILKQIAE